MFDHIDIAVSDLPRSREFYVAVLATLDIVSLKEIQRGDGKEGTGFGREDGPRFWIGSGPPLSGRFHVAFEAETRSAVIAFHAAGLAAGGQDRGAPKLRPRYGEHYYAAYVTDPDGHLIEAVCRLAEN